MITRSKYAYSSSSKSKAWELPYEGSSLQFRTKKEAQAALKISSLVDNFLNFTSPIEMRDMDGYSYVGDRQIVNIGDYWIIAAENKYMESEERVNAVELLNRLEWAIVE